MHFYFKAVCWGAAIVGVAVAGAFGVIDEHSTTTLLVALPVAGWMAIGRRGRCLSGRRA